MSFPQLSQMLTSYITTMYYQNQDINREQYYSLIYRPYSNFINLILDTVSCSVSLMSFHLFLVVFMCIQGENCWTGQWSPAVSVLYGDLIGYMV